MSAAFGLKVRTVISLRVWVLMVGSPAQLRPGRDIRSASGNSASPQAGTRACRRTWTPGKDTGCCHPWSKRRRDSTSRLGSSAGPLTTSRAGQHSSALLAVVFTWFVATGYGYLDSPGAPERYAHGMRNAGDR